MSKNNQIRKSDKKFIRTQKARIRSQFLDIKKQEELITELYKKFLPANTVGKSVVGGDQPKVAEKKEEPKKAEVKKEEKPKSKKEKVVKKSKLK